MSIKPTIWEVTFKNGQSVRIATISAVTAQVKAAKALCQPLKDIVAQKLVR